MSPKIAPKLTDFERWDMEIPPEEPPLRADLCGIEQLDHRARGMAAWHEVTEKSRPDLLLPRLKENERALLRAYRLVTRAAKADNRASPAAEWLLDNFYLIEEQIRLARRHLPKGYSRELPNLMNGPMAGFPRVYEIALELVSCTDGSVNAESLSAFVSAYQSAVPLKLGELWAIPIMLRLALIENLRRVAGRLASDTLDRWRANHWADLLISTADSHPPDVIIGLADMARANGSMSNAFVAEISRRLHGQSPALAIPLTWLEHRLSDSGGGIEQAVHADSQRQAADQISIGNSIGGLRFVGVLDWRDFVENASAVEQALRGDPAGVHGTMTFATRDQYRHVIERIARRSKLSEVEVAARAVDLARNAAAARGDADKTAHVGYYLLDEGERELEAAAKVRFSLPTFVARLGRRHALLSYLGLIFGVTAGSSWLLLAGARSAGFGAYILAAAALPLALASSQFAIAVVNWLATICVKPKLLPKLDYIEGIPPDRRALVVVPTFLISDAGTDDLIEELLIRYLANPDRNLSFALLTDFPDASTETLPGDAKLLEHARRGIEELNEKYRADDRGPFLLLHRPRRWNAKEGAWMGWERKRGKLADLTALLRAEGEDRFSFIAGDRSGLAGVKYVITLDTDTQLPRDAARTLVGAISHPLNRPNIDASTGLVCGGYAILQPRISVTLASAGKSWYARLFAGEAGIDPYTRTVSDVYQDIFGEGSFIGKGILDVDAFMRATRGRFPENWILSHDLLEGCHARAGLVSDVELFENFPASYGADVSRRHRWTRGDWQIAPWTMRQVPGPDWEMRPNPISGLSRWKILDNLRRSLAPTALAFLLALGWLARGPAWYWTCCVLGLVIVPPALQFLVELLRKPADSSLMIQLRTAGSAATRRIVSAVFGLAFLPSECFTALDAIVRTGVRMMRTRRRLLDWQTAREAELGSRADLAGFVRSMWIAPLAAVSGLAALRLANPSALAVASPFLAAWFVSPAIAWWLSRALPERDSDLDQPQVRLLRRTARKTWRFFETFAGAEDQWLPPDNYQKQPVEAVAHQTSPTNIGLYLASCLAARDFGYASVGAMIDRIEKCFDAMKRLERFRGHFYNWYDTRTLKPLLPMYVSTVDSGNLAGFLLALRCGALELPKEEMLPPRVFEGLGDDLEIITDLLGKPGGSKTTRAEEDGLRARMGNLRRELDARPSALGEAAKRLHRIGSLADDLAASLAALQREDARAWAAILASDCRGHLEEITELAPWCLLPALPEAAGNHPPPNWAESFRSLREALGRFEAAPTLEDLARVAPTLGPLLGELLDQAEPDGGLADERRDWLFKLRDLAAEGSARAAERIARVEALAIECEAMSNFDYSFLFDKSRNLLSVGYNASDHRRDTSFYDLLASEARLTTFVAIAQGQIPQESWFALGRLLTLAHGRPALLSWSGSMFEYLLPNLLMPGFESTLLDESSKAAVERQIKYGAERGVPWGISESGYNLTDAQLRYQYRAFGVPGLGLKRGLADDLVIAPYATALALTVRPRAACKNLAALVAEGAEGPYGFYEAIDYTPARLSEGKPSIVQSYMAHHQGMSLLALAHTLLDKPMQRRFESDPRLKATMLLLQERAPRSAPIFPHASEAAGELRSDPESEGSMRVYADPATPSPEVHLLSNGRYSVMITNSGAGYSRWKDIAITRWREDATRDSWGMFFYLRDPVTGERWSATHQPTLKSSERFEAIFPLARAEFKCRHRGIDAFSHVAVSPEDEIEIRRINLFNLSRIPREIELTSFAEVALTTAAADAAHPAFSKLFVRTEILRERGTILCTRRLRSADERPIWMFHLMSLHGPAVGEATYETDRMRFIGRGRSPADPVALAAKGGLSGADGCVLDPIVAIRQTVALEPEANVIVDFVTGVSETREGALALAEKYRDRALADRVFGLALTHGQVVLRRLGAGESDAHVYERLAGSVVYASARRRAGGGAVMRNPRGQSALWSYGISGDLPIVLLRFSDESNVELVRHLVRAHAFWRLKGLEVDLVILNEDPTGYRQALRDLIVGIIASGDEVASIDRPGGIFVRAADQIPLEDRGLLESAARVILVDTAGSLAEQVDKRMRGPAAPPPLISLERRAREASARRPPQSRRAEDHAGRSPDGIDRSLLHFNGLGGFTPDGREYIIRLPPGRATPLPWVNVLANAAFGSVVSESGSAYTWSENAREFRLTPWHNDPVSDPGGEAIYIRNEESGRFWSPTPLPARGTQAYTVRHGFGYTVFEYAEEGIASELWNYVAADAPVKFFLLKIRNQSGAKRRLSVTGFVEWVLGERREQAAMHVVTEVDSKTGAIFARNSYNADFSGRVAFFELGESERTISGDRAQFIGRNGGLADPAAMGRAYLSGKVGGRLDPCAAMQAQFDLADGQEREIAFILGSAPNAEDARNLVQRFRGTGAARQARDGVWEFWKRSLGAIHLESPDPATNALANGWLTYQIWASRLWGRSGFYQSGGAYGFRDQLQDALGLLHSAPWLIREHLLRCAARQFPEGDVQHWWHPTTGKGVRTRFSDDYLWLPWATAQYVTAIGDFGVLDERVGFIQGRSLRPDEESYYDLPIRADETAPLYDHCVRAIVHGLRFGERGLPLMGCGDWNDGMNLVGEKGRGESVWLAFFLYDVLTRFAPIASGRGDQAFAERCRSEAARLQLNIERNAWDGDWYRRAYFDEGEPLGSSSSPECQIDSLPQSWAVLSGAGDAARSKKAMESVDRRLVRRDLGLILLFDPPFDKSELDPGYIKGYPPGVRENGGQYTHAAIWAAMAFGKLGDRHRLWELFQMINPLNSASTPETMARYMAEPYVVAADVYSQPPHAGRGGWTWYTGAASWMHRLITESILGMRLEADRLTFKPCLPPGWESFKLHYRYRETFYHIQFTQRGGGANVARTLVDGVEQSEGVIRLVDDRVEHQAEIELE